MIKKITFLIAVGGLALAQPGFGGDNSGGKVIVAPPAPAPTPVECLTYDYLDLQYLYTDFGRSGVDNGHGGAVNFSKSLGKQLYLAAGADWSQAEVDYENTDLWGGNLGVGYYFPIATNVHVTVEGGGTYDDRDLGGSGYYDDSSSNEWGLYVGPGLRFCAYEGMEVFGNAIWNTREDSGDSWDFQVGVVFDLTEMVGLKIAGIFNDDYDSLLAGLRIYY